MENQELGELRLRIDGVDEKMIGLLSERMQIAIRIGEIKKELNLPIVDVERKKNALAKRLESARKVGLPEVEAQELFEFLHKKAVEIEEKVLKRRSA